MREKSHSETYWNTLQAPKKKNPFWRKQAIQTHFAVLLNCTGGKLGTPFSNIPHYQP